MYEKNQRTTTKMNEKIDFQAETIEVPFRPDENKPYIFISYAHVDKARVFPIIKKIYEMGWRVWYDEGIPVGSETDYLVSLADHISECHIVLSFVTHNSVNRKFVTEKELEYACGDADKRIVFCYLDKDVQLPRSIQLLTAKRSKYPRTDEDGLVEVLMTVDGLDCGKKRKAKGYRVENGVIQFPNEGDDYEFEKCNGGIRLKKYKGNEAVITIPEIYKSQSVVELEGVFRDNQTIKVVHIPATVRKIGAWTFANCFSLTDVYIPSSVKEIDVCAFAYIKFTVHCSFYSEAHKFTIEHKDLSVIFDTSLNISGVTETSEITAYAFCSYAEDKKAEAERIIQQLINYDCSIVSSGSLDGNNKVESMGNSRCFIAFLSREYIETKEIAFLRMAIKQGISYIIYALDDSALPCDIMISKNSEQQLRFDKNEKKEIAVLIEWLEKNNCRKASADIPDYEYTRDTNGNIILTKYNGKGGAIEIPGKYASCPITGIGDALFKDCISLSSVTIPDSVISIGNHAFYGCTSLSSVTIPDSVIYIGDRAFNGCTSLSSVTIPDSVISIGNHAFDGCTSLSSVTIPDSVTKIGHNAFYHCTTLQNINTTNNNTVFLSIDGVLMSKDCKVLFVFPNGRKGDYTIPDSVATIGSEAFYKCSSLTSVTIPDSVTTIGNSTFEECSSLTSVTIPGSVTSIGSSTFEGCSSLSSIIIPDSVTTIRSSTFEGCSSLISVIIPNSVTNIGYGAFRGCSSLSSVIIPDSVTIIGNSAFEGCSSLSSVIIPDSVTSIEDYAFRECCSLTSVTIPDSVTSIGNSKIYKLDSIPCSVTQILWNVFENCDNLIVYCSETSEAWKCCENEQIPHKPLNKFFSGEQSILPHKEANASFAAIENENTLQHPLTQTIHRKKSYARLAATILLALFAAAAVVQFFGLFDILGWLEGLL